MPVRLWDRQYLVIHCGGGTRKAATVSSSTSVPGYMVANSGASSSCKGVANPSIVGYRIAGLDHDTTQSSFKGYMTCSSMLVPLRTGHVRVHTFFTQSVYNILTGLFVDKAIERVLPEREQVGLVSTGR